MGKAMKRGMVLVLSLWDDMLTKMDWLDSETKSKIHPKGFPGRKRGPCSIEAGNPKTLRGQHPNANVQYTNVMVGEIDSTYGPKVNADVLDVVATPESSPAATLPPAQQQQQQQQTPPVQQMPTSVQPAQPVQQQQQPPPPLQVPASAQPAQPWQQQQQQPLPLQQMPASVQPAQPWQQQQQQQQQQQSPPLQQVPASVQPAQPVQYAQPATQLVQPVPAVPTALQPMAPADEVTAGTALNGFCCYFGSNPADFCATCQSKETSVWNANPANCAKSNGTYCSGVVRLFSTDKAVHAVQGQVSVAQMPLGSRLIIFGLAAACGSLVVALAVVRARRPWHDYAAVEGTNQLLRAPEIQEEHGGLFA